MKLVTRILVVINSVRYPKSAKKKKREEMKGKKQPETADVFP